ncbi:hypothetical protein [Leptolyngbya sp. NIES-2104]|uniref:hypothetical protein n=1 Tax=Leptolyngbya sp. NIES-2104 TaxID=1552121 RepID=UPI0006EC5110|nr:hypothetical protein [Leptolyngbya sp. NIES-2104]GAQ00099.1 hypothetical protein NIES2104_66640 [Leptolyngbya sp. NIES-2104]
MNRESFGINPDFAIAERFSLFRQVTHGQTHAMLLKGSRSDDCSTLTGIGQVEGSTQHDGFKPSEID